VGAKLSGYHDWLGPDAVAVILDRAEYQDLDTLWEAAEDEARTQLIAVETVLECAEVETSGMADFHTAEFIENVENGVQLLKRLKQWLDLQGVLRRRNLLPFVLVPRHVALKHGSAEKLSLFTHLRQAQEAFVFGAPFAAVALMRSILETTLKSNYYSSGRNLEHVIENCSSLPPGASKAALHRLRKLANDILHVDKQTVTLPENLEKELLVLFRVLRDLIESAPTLPSTNSE
jgi:hypothetical protein